ncbi:MAG TPA: gluconate:H+ symporter [Bacteroidales bacterium]|nr:gluconate:H+ symporter [Bacteroidales bacterium]HPF02401.1 gluconate:H+ symporter [Bacteroidales bacterium]HPJ60588.1 gluconate:H+ symporter [Bacteroidales bacterium]HPR11094.1 gluconate:H+ symporter [Bacteroidales bacterium]HRW84805.1 gluconate:H+ symporter [Bacteroidales bacterium]
MSPAYIIFIVAAGVTFLLLMVLRFRLNAFIALLVTSILVGILAGMPAEMILSSIEKGMGGTLGFIAVVVGLGAVFGQMLESSGGARAFAHSLLRKFGRGKASWALMLSGFVIGIPVFLDVGFIILIPIVYALARDAQKSVLFYAIPLLAGLAVSHTMIPPTPGPVAVANILGVDIGWVVLFGILTGLPTAVIAGPVFGRYIAGKIKIDPPATFTGHEESGEGHQTMMPSFITIALIIMTPLLLILAGTFMKLGIDREWLRQSLLTEIMVFIGHPFVALIIATFLSIILCIRQKLPGQTILELSTKALGPAGIIILVTGAGGVLKQILIDSGIGKILAESIAGSSIPLVLLGWILSALVRITQGSATVAMITAAGIMAPIIPLFSLSQPETALVVVSIAAGATILSHVNDSGFWIVSKYLGMNEKQTLQSWTVMETIIAVTGLAITLTLSLFVR